MDASFRQDDVNDDPFSVFDEWDCEADWLAYAPFADDQGQVVGAP